jgi:hypothetical protein
MINMFENARNVVNHQVEPPAQDRDETGASHHTTGPEQHTTDATSIQINSIKASPPQQTTTTVF